MLAEITNTLLVFGTVNSVLRVFGPATSAAIHPSQYPAALAGFRRRLVALHGRADGAVFYEFPEALVAQAG